jgi:hypothetical protein
MAASSATGDLKMKNFIPLSTMLVATILLMLALAPRAVASDPTFSFDLTGPQVVKDDGTGKTIQVTGAGSFDPTAGTVVASGAFAIANPGGAVVSHGTWNATAFNSFCPRGGPNFGAQGGVLLITVTLSPTVGNSVTNVTMTINCLIPSESDTTCNPGAEGITVVGMVGDFTDVLRGRTLFQMNG